MVCVRCKMCVERELFKLGLKYSFLGLGEVDLINPMTSRDHDELAAALHTMGLELLSQKTEILVERIKNTIIDLVHYSKEPLSIKLSRYLSYKTHCKYSHLSQVFSEVKGVTIEKYFILHKVEHIKELLIYNEFTLKEIADKMHYSSLSHISNQFKKVTGLTPTHFRYFQDHERKMLEDI